MAFSKLHLWITPKTEHVWFHWNLILVLWCHMLNLPYSTPLRHFLTNIMLGEVSQIRDQGYKVKKKMADFFLKSSLVYMGTSPDTIQKISWPRKEAILEASIFSLNLVESDSKLLEALETSILIQYASVIPFWKPLGVLMKLCTIWLTSEAIRGR